VEGKRGVVFGKGLTAGTQPTLTTTTCVMRLILSACRTPTERPQQDSAGASVYAWKQSSVWGEWAKTTKGNFDILRDS
jgi:hypothetical protein